MSLFKDGVAIEVKVIKNGQSIRQAIGQAFLYRMRYRFVVVVWVDLSTKKEYKELLLDKKSDEARFVEELKEHNIFCVVK